ncbi:MAG: tetratricopeptide repeat protein [Cyanobacteria bacterium CRU_2_1]|nr:tetratricopeptide repeat protein [Cyanobacteria bacterium CRU_2_1]
MDFPLARQRFYQEINQPDEHIHLAKAALFLSQEEYPDLDPEEYLNALETMAAEVKERLPIERYPLRILQTLNHYLYEDLGFHGNTEDYYDPRNSYLNQVIDRRTGIPITLSLVYLEIARQIDLPMVGIGMPGHFLIRPVVSEMQIFVDPFHNGEVMFAEDCQERLNQMYGGSIELRPEFLAPISPRHFLTRMLTNLKAIYLSQGDLPRSLAAIEGILLLFPELPSEQRDRGLVYYHMGRWTEASQDLENYLAQQPTAEDALGVQELLRRMGREA